MAKDDSGEQPQKDLPEDFSDIEPDGHCDGIDLVSEYSLQPVARADFAVVFAVSDDGFECVTAFLAFVLGWRDAAFLA